jgi:putative heme-binding domain-containing protein
VIVQLEGGHTFSGVRVAETESTLTLVDGQGEKLHLAKSTIERQHASALSTMPEDLEKRFSEQEFVDLVAFLAGLKEE